MGRDGTGQCEMGYIYIGVGMGTQEVINTLITDQIR